MTDARVSAAAVEVLTDGTPARRVSAASVEALTNGSPDRRIFATSVEVLFSTAPQPPPPPTLVQTATADNSAAASNVLTATLPAPPKAGNLLVTVMPIAATSVPAGGGPWPGVIADVISQISGSMRVFIFSKIAAVGEPATQTVTFSNSVNTHRLNCYEFAAPPGNVWTGLGQTAINQDSGVAATTLSSGTTAMTNKEVIAVAGFSMSNTITGVTITNGYTPLLNPPITPLAVTGHLILSGPGTQSTTATWPTARRVAGAIATYSVGVPPPTQGSFLALLGE